MTQADPAREMARKHVKEVRDFFYHLMTYALLMIVLVIVDLQTGANDVFLGLDWAFWVVLFWGLGVAGHAISVFFGDYRAERLYREEQDRAARTHFS